LIHVEKRCIHTDSSLLVKIVFHTKIQWTHLQHIPALAIEFRTDLRERDGDGVVRQRSVVWQWADAWPGVLCWCT